MSEHHERPSWHHQCPVESVSVVAGPQEADQLCPVLVSQRRQLAAGPRQLAHWHYEQLHRNHLTDTQTTHGTGYNHTQLISRQQQDFTQTTATASLSRALCDTLSQPRLEKIHPLAMSASALPTTPLHCSQRDLGNAL